MPITRNIYHLAVEGLGKLFPNKTCIYLEIFCEKISYIPNLLNLYAQQNNMQVNIINSERVRLVKLMF